MTTTTDSPGGSGRRRYSRPAGSIRVTTFLWPDCCALVRQHADRQNISASGAVHDLLRRHFGLPVQP